MVTALIVTLLIVGSLAYGLRAERAGVTIRRHPYNNRYNDASAAREDHPELEVPPRF